VLTVDDYGAIRRARRDGMSIRRIAREFGHTRKTVRQALSQAEPPAPTTRVRKAPLLGPVEPIIDRILADDEDAPPKQRHTAAQIHRRLREEHDYPGGYAQVQRYVLKHRRRHRETFIPLGHLPGRRLEADFGHIHVDFPEGRRPVPFLVAAWAYSNAPFVLALPFERTEAILEGMVAAFEFFGAVPREDNRHGRRDACGRSRRQNGAPASGIPTRRSTAMRPYQAQHQAYCGVDLHARTMFLCILDPQGKTLLHQDLPAIPEAFLLAVAPHRDGLVVACECTFSWDWLADTCAEHGIPFVLGHALEMRAIHGSKTKNDKVDSEKIAHLLRVGLLPQAYVYPAEMRATRDLLRRRAYLVRRRSEALTHVQLINWQYQHDTPTGKLRYASNRAGVLDRVDDESVRRTLAVDLDLVAHLDGQIAELEVFLATQAKGHDLPNYYRLRSICTLPELTIVQGLGS
jgi:transposase-like protein